MSDYSVAQFVRNRIDGLGVGLANPLTAIFVPVPTPLQNGQRLGMQQLLGPPRAYVWPSTKVRSHPTMSGPTGYRRDAWTVGVQIRHVYQPQDPAIDQFYKLPALVSDRISTAGASIPIDPDGNVVALSECDSIVTYVGEVIRGRNRNAAIVHNMPVTLVADLSVEVGNQVMLTADSLIMGEPLRTVEVLFEELGGSHVYTAIAPLPSGATVVDYDVSCEADWDAAAVIVQAGDDADPNGWQSVSHGLDIAHARAAASTPAGTPHVLAAAGTLSGDYLLGGGDPIPGQRYAEGGNFVWQLVVTDSAGTGHAGVTRCRVTYALTQAQTIPVAVQ